MSLIESSKQNATIDTVSRLAVTLGVTPDELLRIEIDALLTKIGDGTQAEAR